MLSILIFAGGRGSRLFGSDGGCKSAVRLADGFALIDYALSETSPLGAEEEVILLSPGLCSELPSVIGRRKQATARDVVYAPARGTGRAVVDLVSRSRGDLLGVLPGDVVGATGALTAFFLQAAEIVREIDAPTCVVAATDVAPGESDPGYVVRDQSGVVAELGKGAAATNEVWVGVRLMNRAFGRLYADSWDGRLDDEQHTSAIASASRGSVRSIRCPSLFDVDDEPSLARARELAGRW